MATDGLNKSLLSHTIRNVELGSPKASSALGSDIKDQALPFLHQHPLGIVLVLRLMSSCYELASLLVLLSCIAKEGMFSFLFFLF